MVIEEDIFINANPEKVWDTFTNLTRWRDWNTVMDNVYCDDMCISPGSELICNFRPFLFPINVKIKVRIVVPYKRIVWFAKKKGLSAKHLFTFQNTESGVLVTSKETLTGFLVRNSGFLMPKQRMQDLTRTFLNDLKSASEK
ncbi:MAG: hypothetical protein FJ241_07410 [Nitrospira sp.]|nr:hypothetical protein [Nitrospira sp.]